MAGFIPAIHVFLHGDVDARVKPGHDDRVQSVFRKKR
jgi:hypothetical protein